MEIKLNYISHFPASSCGIFLENSSMLEWIHGASLLTTGKVRIFPVPGNQANSVCGALLIVDEINPSFAEQFPNVYCLGTAFYLLQGSALSPTMNDAVINARFKSVPHFFHPVYGLMELKELKNWSSYLRLKPIEVRLSKPDEGPKFPETLGDYFVREIPPEKVLEELLAKSVPGRKSMDSKPLSALEKVKLSVYRSLLGKKKEVDNGKDDEGLSSNSAATSWWKRRRKKMEQQRDNLEERNKRELDKLMDMLKNNPDEALKYALPIDRSGSSRGPEVGFTMHQRWKSGIRLGTTSSSGGSVNIGMDKEAVLRAKYNEMANNYASKEDWEKASFVYLELLSDPNSAGNVLEKGKKYEAAAAIFLTKCKNKTRAAECYENGRFYGRAIDLYEELDWQLKVGDLYTKMGNSSSANVAYHKEVDKLVKANNFLKAGGVSKEKIKSESLARTHYFSGWKKGNQPNECLNEYFDTFELPEKRTTILKLHEENYDGKEAHHFLEVLKRQSDKEGELKEDIDLILYETVARNARKDRTIVNLLDHFNASAFVSKDVMRFKHNVRG